MFELRLWSVGGSIVVKIYQGLPRTSKASISNAAISFDGAPILCCEEMRLIRSEICCRVGARVIDARLSGSRLPGILVRVSE